MICPNSTQDMICLNASHAWAIHRHSPCAYFSPTGKKYFSKREIIFSQLAKKK